MGRVYRTGPRLLRYFLAVAEELHFGRAVARLNMSQPPLSIYIKEPENQLGTQFFICHSCSVVLIHAGRILMEESCRLLVSANNVLVRVEQIGRGETGRIELGVVGTAIWGQMRPVMRRLLRENPNAEVLFHKKTPAMRMALLERRELDIKIRQMATEPPTGFASLRSHESAFLVAMPGEHHLSSLSAVPLEALRSKYFVIMPPVHTDQDSLQRACQQMGFSPVVTRKANEPQTVLTIVSIGIGITLTADSYVQMNWLGVVFRPLKERIPVDLYIVYETRRVTPALVKLLAVPARQIKGAGTAEHSWSDKRSASGNFASCR